jgi:hypothetical protein
MMVSLIHVADPMTIDRYSDPYVRPIQHIHHTIEKIAVKLRQ